MQKVFDVTDAVGSNIAADRGVSAEETGVQPEIRGTFDIGNGIVTYHNNWPGRNRTDIFQAEFIETGRWFFVLYHIRNEMPVK